MFEEIKVDSPSILVNNQGIIMDANNSMCETFGYETEELRGRHINILIPSGLRDKHDTGFEKFRAGQKTKLNCFRVAGLKKDGQTLFITISVIKNKNSMMAVMKDSTKKELKERALLAKLG